MNEYDSNRIYDLVKKINYKKTENLEDADCYVLNTCHIREKATDKVYHDVGRIKKQFKNRKKPIVVITGCVAQAEGEILLKDEKYIDAVIGPQSFQNFNKILLKIENEKKRINFTNFEVIEKFDTLNSIKTSSSKISSFLTIQEGCDKFCKFCVVPYTRGAEFSRTIDEIVNECNELVSNGAKEISLLGQNVNAYKHKGKNLSDLINEISKIKNLLRIRYTTSHPIDFSNDLIKMHETKEKLMPLIHLPVQSGSNKILNLMNRKHSVEQYLNLISKLKQINPLIKFSSDFIIGYPGETDIDFEDTLKLLKEVNFINTYSFIYSPRPGTPAAKMNKTDMSISRQRLERFQKIADEIKLKYRLNLVKQKSSVLVENRVGSKNEFFGRDEFSNSVIVKSDEDINGKIKDVIIKSVNRNTLFGEINQKIDRSNFAA